MSKALDFTKMSGAGNDFVLVEGPVRRAAALARRLCDRREGVGADGLLVVDRRPVLRLAYYNADGSEAFCGNGSRCAAWWMSAKGWAKGKSFSVDSSVGRLAVRVVSRRRAAVRMPAPKRARLGLSLSARGRRLTAHFIDTGVPHAVVFVKDLGAFPVEEIGKSLRYNKAFTPEGANVDFVERARGGLALRTYERGVEAETLACGTGAVASAAVACLLGLAKSPVSLKTKGADVLKVSFNRRGKSFDDVWLEGPAKIVFSGEFAL